MLATLPDVLQHHNADNREIFPPGVIIGSSKNAALGGGGGRPKPTPSDRTDVLAGRKFPKPPKISAFLV
jgi:hypothetical protein